MKLFRRIQRSPDDEKLHLENGLVRSKSIMYTTLSFFIGMQSIVSILVAVLLAFLVISIIVLVLIVTSKDQELFKMIFYYYLQKIIPGATFDGGM